MFRRKSKTPRIDLADFMKDLADQYSCESPYELGIRIQSLGLPISVRFSIVVYPPSPFNKYIPKLWKMDTWAMI